MLLCLYSINKLLLCCFYQRIVVLCVYSFHRLIPFPFLNPVSTEFCLGLRCKCPPPTLAECFSTSNFHPSFNLPLCMHRSILFSLQLGWLVWQERQKETETVTGNSSDLIWGIQSRWAMSANMELITWLLLKGEAYGGGECKSLVKPW